MSVTQSMRMSVRAAEAARVAEITELIAGLVRDLRRVHREAGDPSYSEMIKKARPQSVLSKATICRALQGEKMPTWRVTEGILRGCGLDERSILSWKQRWVRVADQIDRSAAAPEPDHRPGAHRPAGMPTGTECESCGAWVLDAARHLRWHESLEPGRRLTLVRPAGGKAGRS